jgi:hypothetical protein
MKNILFVSAFAFLLTGFALRDASPEYDTSWLSTRPEVLTYRTTSDQGNGLYQVALVKNSSTIDIIIDIITPGFAKTVHGTMTSGLQPIASGATIVIDTSIMMKTTCSYSSNSCIISTTMLPYNRIICDTLKSSLPIIDFSQTPVLPRFLNLSDGSSYTFSSLNPRNNKLVPLTIRVIGDGFTGGVRCWKVEVKDFEGTSVVWIEKEGNRRIMLVEQPEQHRRTELVTK